MGGAGVQHFAVSAIQHRSNDTARALTRPLAQSGSRRSLPSKRLCKVTQTIHNVK